MNQPRPVPAPGRRRATIENPPEPAPRRHANRASPPSDAAADPSAAASALASSVWELMRGFVRGHDPSDELRRTLGLGRGEGRVKALISLAAGPLSLSELAQAIGADPSYTTIIVNELQALRLVSRTPDAQDRRRKAVELTADGREAVREAQDIIARPPSPLRDMSEADLLRLREILGQLSAGSR
jgi:DNA-binding MarR family transcriptional regulator